MATLLPVGPNRDQTFIADEAMTSAQYCMVKHVSGTAGHVTLADGTEQPIGILQNAPASGGQAVVRTLGESNCSVNAGTAITIGCGICPTTDGVGVKNTTDNYWIVGHAREALASGTGTIVVDVCAQREDGA